MFTARRAVPISPHVPAAGSPRASRLTAGRSFTAALILTSLQLTGCVVFRYTPKAHTSWTAANIDNAEEVQMTIGPWRELDLVATGMRRAEPRIEIVDALRFRDAAFPTGDWTLRTLLEPGGCHWDEEYGPDYLAIVDSLILSSKGWGFFAWYVMFLGLDVTKESGRMTALVVDLERRCELDLVTSEGRGRGFAAGFGPVIAIVPVMSKSTVDGLAAAIARRLAQQKPAGAVRVAVMAAEFTSSVESRELLETIVEPR